MPKGILFTPTDDLVLTRAWRRTSQDPTTGTNQKSGVFWKKVHDNYFAIMQLDYDGSMTVEEEEKRTIESLKSRWQRIIAKECRQWDAILTTNRRRSGMGEQDYVALCQEMYAKAYGKPFRFLVSFIELDDVPAFNMHRSTANNDDDDDAIPPSILDNDDDDDDENVPTRNIADNGAIVFDHPEQRRGTAISTINMAHQARPMGVKKAKKRAQEDQYQAKVGKMKLEILGDVLKDSLKDMSNRLVIMSNRSFYLQMANIRRMEPGKEAEAELYLGKGLECTQLLVDHQTNRSVDIEIDNVSSSSELDDE
jgi:hypothetical protein